LFNRKTGGNPFADKINNGRLQVSSTHRALADVGYKLDMPALGGGGSYYHQAKAGVEADGL
jgi:hypothetical protein